jgi:hypothetical protein
VVLSDQIKSLYWTKRDIEYIIKATEEEIKEVVEKITILINESFPKPRKAAKRG